MQGHPYTPAEQILYSVSFHTETNFPFRFGYNITGWQAAETEKKLIKHANLKR